MREHGFEFGEFYALLAFATAGMQMLAMATDMVSIFIGVETMSIAVYVLTGSWRHSPKSAEGAMNGGPALELTQSSAFPVVVPSCESRITVV